MKVQTHNHLITYIKEHLDETGEKPSAFGRRVLGDSASISRIFNGTDPRLSTVNKIVKEINNVSRSGT